MFKGILLVFALASLFPVSFTCDFPFYGTKCQLSMTILLIFLDFSCFGAEMNEINLDAQISEPLSGFSTSFYYFDQSKEAKTSYFLFNIGIEASDGNDTLKLFYNFQSLKETSYSDAEDLDLQKYSLTFPGDESDEVKVATQDDDNYVIFGIWNPNEEGVTMTLKISETKSNSKSLCCPS